MIEVPAAWTEAAESLREGVVMLVGARDTGKSTFAKWLAGQVAGAWVVDADVGQSDIGPPTTVGARRWPDGEDCLYFVGSDSPRGHMLQAVVGTGRLVQEARTARAPLIVINTTGWVDDGAAAALKAAKIDLVRPDWIVQLGTTDVAAAFRFTDRPRLITLPASPGVRQRGPEQREVNRRAAWDAYLRPARALEVALADVGLSGGSLTGDQRGRVVGLFDALDACVAVGPILGLAGNVLRVLAPFPADSRVARVHLGSIAVPGYPAKHA